MTSDILWPFLTSLPIMSDSFYPITSNIWGFFGPPYLPYIQTFPCNIRMNITFFALLCHKYVNIFFDFFLGSIRNKDERWRNS
jgi:hypothetical protein